MLFLYKHKKSKNITFFKRTFLLFFMSTLTITILLTSFLSINYLKTSISLTHTFNDNLLQQSNYSITYLNEMVDKLSISLLNDKDIIAFLNSKDSYSLNSIIAGKVIDKYLLPLSYIDSVYLYNAELDLFFSSETGEQSLSNQFSDSEIVNLLQDKEFLSTYRGEPISRHIDSSLDSADTCSYIIFESRKNNIDFTNAIIINIDTKILTESIQSINNFDQTLNRSFIVADKNGTILSSCFNGTFENQNYILTEVQQRIRNSIELKKRFLDIDGVKYLLSYNNQNLNDWFMISLVPTGIIFKDIIYSSLVGIFIVICILVFCIGICFLFARRLTTPLKAITKLVSGQKLDNLSKASLKAEEFQLLLSVFESMKEQNTQLDKLKKETSYSIKQDFLNSLVSGSTIHSTNKVIDKLQGLNLSYLATSQLCMCIFKIDHYMSFLSENNQKERWALQFAISNITTEIATKYFTCEVFYRDSDKFVLIVEYASSLDYKEFQETLEQMLQEIQLNIKNCINLSLSIAYSTLFKGLEHFPSMYENMNDSILLRMKCGHSCIISPYMVDEMNTDDFEIPINKEEILIQKIIEGQYEIALENYKQISNQLFKYSYNEVMHCIIHLMYNIYTNVLLKVPRIKHEMTLLLNKFMIDLQNAEISADIDNLMIEFINNLCTKIDSIKSSAKQQSSDIITQRICSIIEKDYANNNLCLSSIAEELSLSPNYVGHLFKLAQNKSISQYIFDLRMEKLAYYLNNTSLPLTTIIEKVGLEKNNYFYTRFKKHFGMSLGEYKLHITQKDT